MRYPNDSDVNLRLGETFIKYKGECYFAKCKGSKFEIILYKQTTGGHSHVVSANDPEVDITSLEVGFVQYNPFKVWYVCRAPYRKQKQGICYENLIWRPIGTPEKGGEYYFESLHPDAIYGECFMNMLDNKYPAYQEAHDAVVKTAAQKAFGKKLALVSGKDEDKIDLYLNCQKIAQKKRADTHFFLNPDYNNTTTAIYLTSKGVPLY